MTETRIKISSIIQNQLPQFIEEEFPLVSEFLKQYYISLENQGGVSDILQNIDRYIKVDNLTNLVDSTVLSSDITFFDSTINVTSTAGFPDSYGLLLIDSEIITYTSKTSTTFEGCIRGFSGVTSYTEKKDELTFKETESQEHISSSIVSNLSILFLKQFLYKVKKQITPGFEDRELYSKLNERLFIKQSIDFYSSKGTDNSFKILFGALYGEPIEVIRPRDYLIQPSDAQYRITADLVVESVEGNPENLINKTLYQDDYDNIRKAQGTITKVEKIVRNTDVYYLISLDYDYDKDILPVGSIYGKFSIHPSTKVVSEVFSNSSTIDVDSTVSFPLENGNLVVNLENGTTLNINYTSKTLNQFLGCSGIDQGIPKNTLVKLNSFAYGYLDAERTNEVKVRILGVLSELEIPQGTALQAKQDHVKIKTLGSNLKDFKFNNWFFNVSSKYSVSKISILDEEGGDIVNDANKSYRLYRIETHDDHLFRIGDSVTFTPSAGTETTGSVTSFNNIKSFTVKIGSGLPPLNLNLEYFVEKNLQKVRSDIYPEVNKYTSNIQNIYYDSTDKSLYVASPSLPSYLDKKLEVSDRSISFSGTYSGETLRIGKHGFYTGDSIVYKSNSSTNNLGISTGIYFVKKVSDTEIKLSRSKSNIFNENFVTVNGTVNEAKFELTEFTFRNLETQLLESQKLIRKIAPVESDGKIYKTEPGLTGIFINGVEILNYKSRDDVFYGPIESIIPTSNGENYDVINPPILSILDPIGFGASAYCSVIGNLDRIEILDPGFDYIDEPIIEISGGNGVGASAKVNLIGFTHEVSFNSHANSGLVKLNPTNTIGFSSYHKFRDFEEIVYITDGQTSVGGLSTNSTYFASVQDEYNIKLYSSLEDANVGINTIIITSYGTGNHLFRSKNKKSKIGSITVDNSGSNYQNKFTYVEPIGINTASNTISIKQHGYNSGEIIVYNPSESPIGGLAASTQYYVTKVDDDNFKLSPLGISTLGFSTSFYYESKQYVNLISVGSGLHQFNYPEIKVLIRGRIGISTVISQDVSAKIQPIFRGQIQSVFVGNGGKNYGSEDIINYNRQPLFNLNSGSGSQVTPVISNGSIVDVLINSPGSNYNSPPDLKISGNGFGAVLTPIISNGSLVEVKIIYGGSNYGNSNTKIEIIPAGKNAKFESKIKSWKINLVERLIQNTQVSSQDDGILTSGINSDYGLQYTHAYASRDLRSSVQGTSFKNGRTIYTPDLQTVDNKEVSSASHSPIIGWSYDGNPIYGPYGFSSPTAGIVTCLRSGYKLKLKNDRPSTSLYPQGFFVEDFEYTADGDLDECNGRFTITPEYPNGIYAYFTTINPGNVESTPPFTNYKRPIFPYVIGDFYKSKPIEFNFNTNSNQDYIDINATTWKRNTTPYNLLNQNSTYDYLLNLNNIKQSKSVVNNVLSGSISSVGIITGGFDYKVGDRLVFESPTGYGARASVSLIEGKKVSQISVASSTFDNVVFYPVSNNFVGFTTIPHGYLDNDLITFTGDYDFKKSGNIIVTNNVLKLTSGIGSVSSTGIVTYFNVSGNLNYPTLRENDLYQIGNEVIKVLNIDKVSSRIRVLRNQTNLSGILTHSAGIGITEKSRKFRLSFGISTSYNYDLDREIYFDPGESVGLGTTSGVGIVSTIYISNPGVGNTQITIPTQTIFIENHNFTTGDSLTYSSNGGTQISVSTDGVSSFSLGENSNVYAAKITNNLLGISTIKISDGNFVGLGTTVNGLLYFTSVGTGNTHSFKTNYTNKLIGQVSKNSVTVSTAETHGLSLFDNVTIEVTSGISTTIIIKYDDYNRRLLVNPRSFLSINIDNDSIIIQDHGYYTGQKVLYVSNTPASGLVNNTFYYVVVVNSNTIKLSSSYYDATINVPKIIDIKSSSAGTISAVNPPLEVTKNQNVIFDVSDSSLSFISNSVIYPAFDLKFYKNNSFTEEFNSSQLSSLFEISRSGRVGIDSTAKVTLSVNDNVPRNIYYNLVPINRDINSTIKKEIYIDSEVKGFCELSIKESGFSGNHTIVGITSTTYTYNISEKPELFGYSDGVKYFTNSTSAKGSISKISIFNQGRNYYSLPKISNILSDNGYGAVLIPNTFSIGKISSTYLDNIGLNYSSDYSIRPTAKFPDVLSLEPLSSFDYIDISSNGKNYNSPPSLIVLDGLTNKVVNDVELRYSLGDSRVTIVKNTASLNKVTPKIIPTNNSNGLEIQNIVYNSSTKDVVVTLGASFSSILDFPFSIGSKVLIEGISVGVGSTGKGFNSSNYGYSLFTIKNVDPNIGGIGATVSYSLSSYLSEDEIPGNFNNFNSYGKIIPESHFPIFNPVLKVNNFYKGEVVYSETAEGEVVDWDSDNQYLRVSSSNDFEVGQKIKTKSSGSTGIVKNITSYETSYKVDAFSPRRKGWNRETGFLNNDFQRMHDNDYYQYFSYELKSRKDLNTWDNSVSTLNHTAGFKKFGNLIMESIALNAGISTDQNNGDFTGTADLSGIVSLNCVYDFDLAKENNIIIDGNIKSNEIVFNSRVIQDYIESIGNRVLVIDDISNSFNSNPRPTVFSVVDSFDASNFRSKKYIASIQDKRFSNEIQLSMVSLLYDNNLGFINQYGIYSNYDLGSFDFNVSGSSGNLLFYPINSKFNDYYVKLFSFSLNDSISGIGTVNLGDSVKLTTSTFTLSQGTSSATTIVGLTTSYRSSKVLVQIGSTDSSYYQYDEISIIHDNSNVYLVEYGQITTNSLTSKSSSGIGTYSAYISGSDLRIDFIPNQSTNVDYVFNCMSILLGNADFSGIGTQSMGGGRINSSSVAISSSSSPTSNVIASYSNVEHNASYCIVSIEDKTNLQYQLSEILVMNNTEDSYMAEFGIVKSNSTLGIITAGQSLGDTNVYCTPIKDIDLDVKVFQVNVGLNENISEIFLNNGSLNYDYGEYTGTNNDIKKDFELTHKNLPIFQRFFDGSNPSIVNIDSDTIQIPNHFFVSGEEITYSYPGAGTTQSIGIATTSIVGLGTTDKLPSTLYVVKVSNSAIKVSTSSSEALKSVPNVLDLTSVGIGQSHVFTSKNQNSKVIVGIDNLIQSPIVSTSVTSLLSKNVGFFDGEIYLSSVDLIYGGDLLRIDDEILKVASVGVGSTNSVSVIRSWMGTGLSTHSSSTLVTKVIGNYNIIDNKIYFSEAPYGKISVLSSSNSPDEIDYTGIITSSSFSGRVFLRNGESDTLNETYSTNYIFDDISNNFNGIQKSFNLTANGFEVTGISTDNVIVLINDIFQSPNSTLNVNNYDLTENLGITSITFTGIGVSSSYDVNTASIPRGGIIISVGSTNGFGYQPLVSAGGTAIVSVAGTIQSISIGNSGSGYRSGIQTFVNVGVKTESLNDANIEYIGTAVISNGNIVGVSITNPGIGYTSSNPPIVVFDSPLSYSNLPLIYSSSSPSGFGTGATVDIIVGQGSSVISFEIKNLGYGYSQNEILTVSVGGSVGIPTSTSFSEFQITIEKTQSDKFAAWSVGSLQVIDPIDSLFDGKRTVFPININGNQTTIRSRKGSIIDEQSIQASLLIFINDVLQVPGDGYIFKGGSTIRFTEPPKEGDTSKIIFYRGTGGVDTQTVDILENIKVGDTVTLKSDDINLTENERLVTQIVSSDTLDTNLYSGPGISNDENLLRPLTWCRQTEDLFVNGQQVGKDRVLYEPYVQPTTNIIQNISTGSTDIFVESVKSFFDSEREYLHDGANEKPQNKILIISQDSVVSASATAVVSTSGTISSVVISNGGVGYTTSPTVTISGPVGFGTTTSQNTAKGVSIISDGVVIGVAITSGGNGYLSSQPPIVLIEPPSTKLEVIDKVSYEGDFGVITGVSTISVGVASTGIVFDFFIPTNSILRDSKILKVGVATTGISGIQTGYYFTISKSNVGKGLTSLNSSGGIVGIGTSFIDNVYQVAAVSIAQTAVLGIGITNVAKVTVSVSSYNGLSGLGFSGFYGEYSWGRISTPTRTTPQNFISYANVGGISTSPIIQRFNRLKYIGYSTT